MHDEETRHKKTEYGLYIGTYRMHLKNKGRHVNYIGEDQDSSVEPRNLNNCE